MAAGLGVARRDGRRVGAVRGVGPPAARRHRHRARDRLGQVVAGRRRARSSRSRSTRTRSRRSASTPCRSPGSRRGRCSTRARPPSATSPRSSRAAARRRWATRTRRSRGDFDVDELLAEPYVTAPLRKHDLPPISDGAAAMIIATADEGAGAHRHARCGSAASTTASKSHHPGLRDLTESPSTRLAGEARRRRRRRRSTSPSCRVSYSHEEMILREALGLGDDVDVNPSGGPLAGQPGDGHRARPRGRGCAPDRRARRRTGRVAHATSGPGAAAEPRLRAGRRSVMAVALRGRRHRPDQVQEAPRRPLARRASCARPRCARSTTPS